MGFCTYSVEASKDDFVKLENQFIINFVPGTNADALRVYLWGLYKCNNPNNADNTLADMSHTLNMSEEDIISCYKYWQELGLVQVLHMDQFQIKYLPVSSGSLHLKKYNKDKYKSFNITLQEIFGTRMISTNEYNEI